MEYPEEKAARKLMVEIGRRMYERGMVAANDGNISVRLAEDIFLTTPTCVSKGFLKAEELVLVDGRGRVLSGDKRPSSELKMHLRVYQENSAVGAVTHAHPPIATAFAVAGIPLDQAILTEAVVNLGVIPVAAYATPGTEEVPESIAPFCLDYHGVLLANHGALTWGEDLLQAFYRLESLEMVAKTTLLADFLPQKRLLSAEQVQTLVKSRKNFGIHGGGIPQGAAQAKNLQPVWGRQGKQEAEANNDRET